MFILNGVTGRLLYYELVLLCVVVVWVCLYLPFPFLKPEVRWAEVFTNNAKPEVIQGK